MSEEQPFIRFCAEQAGDKTPILVFCDFLQDQENAFAEQIRFILDPEHAELPCERNGRSNEDIILSLLQANPEYPPLKLAYTHYLEDHIEHSEKFVEFIRTGVKQICNEASKEEIRDTNSAATQHFRTWYEEVNTRLGDGNGISPNAFEELFATSLGYSID